MKGTILSLILATFGCAGKAHFTGHLAVTVNPAQAFDVKASALSALDRWAACGYASSLPKTVVVLQDDLQADKPAYTRCAIAEIGGNVITIDNVQCHDSLEDVFGHEILHLIGMNHEDAEAYCNFNRVLAACGFDISRSGPLECRDF